MLVCVFPYIFMIWGNEFSIVINLMNSFEVPLNYLKFLVPYHCKKSFRMLLNQHLTLLNDVTEILALE